MNASEMPSRQIIKTSLGIVTGRPLRATNLAAEIQYLSSQHFHSVLMAGEGFSKVVLPASPLYKVPIGDGLTLSKACVFPKPVSSSVKRKGLSQRYSLSCKKMVSRAPSLSPFQGAWIPHT